MRNLIFAFTLVALVTNSVTMSAQPQAVASALRQDLQARRARLMEKLGSGSMAILWSAPARVYSRDVDYEYRQDSDLLYLTGIEQPDTVLVLVPGSPRRSEVLFITPPNPRREHYVGKFLTTDEARARTGIETVLLTTEFDQFLAAMRGAGLECHTTDDDVMRVFVPDERGPRYLFTLAAQHKVQVRHLRASVPTLEDVFAKAVGES